MGAINSVSSVERFTSYDLCSKSFASSRFCSSSCSSAITVIRPPNAGTVNFTFMWMSHHVSVFFVAFVLYYYVNWKYVSELWPLN